MRNETPEHPTIPRTKTATTFGHREERQSQTMRAQRTLGVTITINRKGTVKLVYRGLN